MQKGGFRGSCNYTSLFFGALILALAALLSAGSLVAQTATGTVTGTVTDPQGLVMADVTVLVRDTDTGSGIFLSHQRLRAFTWRRIFSRATTK